MLAVFGKQARPPIPQDEDLITVKEVCRVVVVVVPVLTVALVITVVKRLVVFV